MSVSRLAVAGGSSALTLITGLSGEWWKIPMALFVDIRCLNALENNQYEMTQYFCPENLNGIGIVMIVVVAGVVFLLIEGKEILEYLDRKLSG